VRRRAAWAAAAACRSRIIARGSRASMREKSAREGVTSVKGLVEMRNAIETEPFLH
jgi:hypothetical protein